MSMGSWFKAYKKSLIIHTSIIVGFVLLTVFVSEPLFDSLERISGEAKLQQLQLPAETNNIMYEINPITTDGHTGVEISGWWFVEGLHSINRELYIVLKSAQRTYVFDSQLMYVHAVYPGFKTIIPARKISNSEYTVGIYIRSDDIEALQYIDKAIVKSKDGIEVIG
jgi:hypothetical protein